MPKSPADRQSEYADRAPQVTPTDGAVLELPFVGEIGAGKAINVAAVRRALAAQTFDCVHLRINSTGGDSEEAFEIYDTLRALPVPVKATATKHCLSGGLIVFMAASLRLATPGTEFLIHPASIARDQLPERVTDRILRHQADHLAKTDNRIADLLAARTGTAREWFLTEGETEEPLSASDLVARGIAHEVEGLTGPCDPSWPDLATRVLKDQRVFLPRYMATVNYFDACRTARFFPRPAGGSATVVNRALVPGVPSVPSIPRCPRLASGDA